MKWGNAWLVRGAPPRHALLINQPCERRTPLPIFPPLFSYLSSSTLAVAFTRSFTSRNLITAHFNLHNRPTGCPRGCLGVNDGRHLGPSGLGALPSKLEPTFESLVDCRRAEESSEGEPSSTVTTANSVNSSISDKPNLVKGSLG